MELHPAQVIKNVESYPTMTDFAISANAPEQLENWRRTNTLGANAFRVHPAVDTVGAYGLTWAHRDVAEDSLANGALFCASLSVWSGRGLRTCPTCDREGSSQLLSSAALKRH